MFPLTPEQTKRLTEYLMAEWNAYHISPVHRRNALLAGIMLHGLRCSEATNIRRIDLNPTACQLRVRTLKRGPYRLINTNPNWTAAAINLYTEMHLRHGGTRWLFTTRTGSQVQEPHMFKYIRRVCRGLFNIEASPHVLRHTAAMAAWRETHDPIAVKTLLGHKWLHSTWTYLKTMEPVPVPDAITIAQRQRTALTIYRPPTKGGAA